MRKALFQKSLTRMQQNNFIFEFISRIAHGNQKGQIIVILQGFVLSLILGLSLGKGLVSGALMVSTICVVYIRFDTERTREVILKLNTLTAIKIINKYTKGIISLYSKSVEQDYRQDLALAMEEEYREAYRNGGVTYLIKEITMSNLYLFWDIARTHTTDRLDFLGRRIKS